MVAATRRLKEKQTSDEMIANLRDYLNPGDGSNPQQLSASMPEALLRFSFCHPMPTKKKVQPWLDGFLFYRPLP